MLFAHGMDGGLAHLGFLRQLQWSAATLSKASLRPPQRATARWRLCICQADCREAARHGGDGVLRTTLSANVRECSKTFVFIILAQWVAQVIVTNLFATVRRVSRQAKLKMGTNMGTKWARLWAS
jgi:hypothetical protein